MPRTISASAPRLTTVPRIWEREILQQACIASHPMAQVEVVLPKGRWKLFTVVAKRRVSSMVWLGCHHCTGISGGRRPPHLGPRLRRLLLARSSELPYRANMMLSINLISSSCLLFHPCTVFRHLYDLYSFSLTSSNLVFLYRVSTSFTHLSRITRLIYYTRA